MLQPDDSGRNAKRIKTEHGEDIVLEGIGSPSSAPVTNGQRQESAFTPQSQQPALTLPEAKMGPPSAARPSISTTVSHTNGDGAAATATPTSAVQSPSPQPGAQQQQQQQQQTTKGNVGPGRVPYQFGMGLPTPGINFTRTPTTGSFVVSSSNSRQQTPTESRNISRAPSAETKAAPSTTNNAVPSGNVAASSGMATPVASRKDGVDQLQDLLSISGVDLRAEEEAAQRNPLSRASFNTASVAAVNQANGMPQLRQSQFFLELYPLSKQMHILAEKHGLRVDPAVLTYLSLAAKTRFQNLLQAMVASSRHRTWSSHLRPPPMYEKSGQAMYHEEIHDDPLKLLAALTKVEKRQEQDSRQARIEREEAEANNESVTGTEGQDQDGQTGEASSSGQVTISGKEGEDGNKKKPKKPGSSSTARNMSEDKRLKLANKTAAQALGISSAGAKSWMFGTSAGGMGGSSSPFGSKKPGAGGSRLPKPRFAPQVGKGEEDGAGSTPSGGQGEGGSGSGTPLGSTSVGGWGDLAARQRLREEEERKAVRRVNLHDALHALEMERCGGAGRGSGEMILYTTRALGKPPTRKL